VHRLDLDFNQRELLEFIWKGADYKMIANHRGTSVEVIRQYVSDIYKEIERCDGRKVSAENNLAALRAYVDSHKKEMRPFGDR
jgi:DNA-binding NarL/FixJ family response regulator